MFNKNFTNFFLAETKDDINLEERIIEILKKEKSLTYIELKNILSVSDMNLLLQILRKLEIQGRISRKDIRKSFGNGMILTSEFTIIE